MIETESIIVEENRQLGRKDRPFNLSLHHQTGKGHGWE